MHDLSEQERQDMIQRAKGGDPQANYELALWALDQAEEEPEEERWNRLAAKCLVKAAQGGYGPAVEHTAHLLQQTEAGEPEDEAAPERPKSKAPAQQTAQDEPADAEEFDWDGYQEPEQERASANVPAPGVVAKAAAVVGIAGRWLKRTFRRLRAGKDGQEENAGGSHRAKSGKGGLAGFFSGMTENKWKRMEIICIAACVLLALLITILIVTGRKNKAEAEDEAVPTPATVVQTVDTDEEETTTSDYPSDTVKEEIASAVLSIYPSEEDYVTEETTATVSATGGLNLRRGPGSSYGQIILMANGTSLEVYAYKNGWALVLYDGDTWGWCSADYIS
ncbi:MAG: SH3 domain-containing protein [Oscillospiraceae bacterium]|nr:SH3 domain-containing protein [Oscillospiraceae bacterium]